MRSAALDNLFANLDSYTLSARNYYLYQNTTLGRWQWIKWDCNETFGSYAFGVPGDMTQLDVEFDGGNYDRPLLERILANENLKNAYLAEVCELRELYFNSEYLDPRLDAVQALIQSAVYNDDNKMYSNADFAANFDNNLNTGGPGGGGGPGGALYGLHSFVADRSAFVANEVDCSGLGTSGLYDWQPFTVYPNPTDGRVTLAWNASGEHPTIELYDLSGQLAGIIKTGSRQTTHELNLPPGLYFLKPTKGVPSSAVVLQIIQ